MSENKEKYTDEEKTVMRIYLQRMEVRLSTMHRIAGVFLNGAGLLILFPVLLRDTIADIHEFAFGYVVDLWETALYLEVLIYAILFIPFFISLILPLYTLYRLLKDIVQFYFWGHMPGFPDDSFFPRFSLSAVAFSPDESERVKRDVMQREYKSEFTSLVVPLKQANNNFRYLAQDEIARRNCIPVSREQSKLEKLGVIEKENVSNNANRNIDFLNIACGLSGLVDNQLIDEVVKMELSLVRNSIHLRRLVLRYTKALMLVVWTTLISFTIASSLTTAIEFHKTVAIGVLISGYGFWTIMTPIIIKRPIKWIWELANQHSDLQDVQVDKDLFHFERKVKILCWISGGCLILAAIVTVYHLFTSI